MNTYFDRRRYVDSAGRDLNVLEVARSVDEARALLPGKPWPRILWATSKWLCMVYFGVQLPVILGYLPQVGSIQHFGVDSGFLLEDTGYPRQRAAGS